MNTTGYTRIAHNTLFLVSGRLISRIMQFFLLAYAARRLGAGGFGVFSYGYATVNLCAIAADIGISTFMVQKLSHDASKTADYMGKALSAKALLAGPVLLLILMVGFFSHKDVHTMWVLFILGLGVIFDSLTGTFSSVFEAYEKMSYPAVVIAVSNLLMSAIGIWVLYFFKDPLVLAIVYAGGSIMRLGFSGIWCIRHHGPPRWSAPDPRILDLIVQGFPFALVTIFVSIYYYIDTVILGLFCTDETVGQYNAAYRLLEAPLFMIQALTTALFPAVAKSYAASHAELRRVMSQVFQKSWAFGLSIAVVMALTSQKLIELVYGASYGEAAPLLTVLIFSAAIIMPGTVCGTTLRAMGRQTVSAWVTGAGALLNIGLNLVLIPRYAALGAAWATLATEAIVLVVNVRMIRRYVGPIFKWQALARAAVLAGLWVVTTIVTQDWAVIYQILLCTMLFLPFLWVTGIIKMNEVNQLLGKNPKGGGPGSGATGLAENPWRD